MSDREAPRRACTAAILATVLLAAMPAGAQVVPPPQVNAPAPGAGPFGSGLSGPAQATGPAPQFRAPPPLPRAQNLDSFGKPFTTTDPSSGLPTTPPFVPGTVPQP